MGEVGLINGAEAGALTKGNQCWQEQQCLPLKLSAQRNAMKCDNSFFAPTRRLFKILWVWQQISMAPMRNGPKWKAITSGMLDCCSWAAL
jgi:hypothetical protein